VIVTHDSELAEKTDMQIYLKDGEIEKIVGKNPKPKKANTPRKKIVRMV
jgi:ABC-type lipoprotein export system ATPase subunit